MFSHYWKLWQLRHFFLKNWELIKTIAPTLLQHSVQQCCDAFQCCCDNFDAVFNASAATLIGNVCKSSHRNTDAKSCTQKSEWNLQNPLYVHVHHFAAVCAVHSKNGTEKAFKNCYFSVLGIHFIQKWSDKMRKLKLQRA